MSVKNLDMNFHNHQTQMMMIIVVVVGKTSSLQHGNHYICNDNKLIQIIEWESLPNGTIRLFELDAYYEINDVIDKIVSGPFRPLPYELNQMNPKTTESINQSNQFIFL